MRQKLAFGVAFVALVVAGFATYAWAASSAGQTINACVNDEGKLRLVPAVSACKKSEDPLTWNTVGPAGPEGQPGAQGPAGQQGPAGPAGAAGKTDRRVAPGRPNAADGTVSVTGASKARSARHRSRSPASRTRSSRRATRRPACRPVSGSTSRSRSRSTGQVDAVVPERAREQREPHLGVDRPAAERAAGCHDQADEREHRRLHRERRDRTLVVHVPEDQWTWLDGGISASDDWEAPVS